MSISVEVKMTGDLNTPEHQAAMKAIMDAVEQAANNLTGLPYPVTPSRMEIKTSIMSRMLASDGMINPEPFPAPMGFMHQAQMQFGFHLNPVKPAEPQACTQSE